MFLKDEQVQGENGLALANEKVAVDRIVFDPDFSQMELIFLNGEAIFHISREVCSKIIKFIKCDDCRAIIETVSHDTVRQPSDVFVSNFKKIFCIVNESLPHICHEKYVRMQLLDLVRGLYLDVMGCSEHFKIIENKLKEQTVVFIIFTFCKNVNDLLSAKTKFLAPDCNFVEEMAFTFKKKKRDVGKYVSFN